MLRAAALILILLLAAGRADSSDAAPAALLEWRELAPLPDPIGFAGAFAGTSNGALIVAGGANFPGGPPWQGNRKVWHDRIFVLDKPDGTWRQIEQRLTRTIACGVSVTTPGGIICIGGFDAERHYPDVFRVEWIEGKIRQTPLPPLPMPLAHMAGALVKDSIYLAGGSESPSAMTATKHFLRLDLSEAEKSWRALPPWPGPERVIPVAGVQEGGFFLMSGVRLLPGKDGKPGREYLVDAYRYAPDSGWKRIADLPHPAAAAPSPAAAIGPSHLFVFGGDDGRFFSVPQQDHGGFAPDVLAYHTITNTWSRVGTDPAPRAVTPVVRWGGGFVIPTGEVRAGVRSPAVNLVTPKQTKSSFGFWNYLTLASYPLIMLAISYFVGRKRTSDEFFRGGQRIPWWAAGISIYATMLSSITYMAVPAKAYATDWSYFVKTIGFLAVTPIVAYVYLPFFRQLDVTSAYEYLEKRFNLVARWFGSASFMILQLGRTAIVLYLPSLALATVTQFDIVTCILVMGGISILMTFLGGVEAVVWTDVAQTIIFLAGVAVTFVFMKLGSGLTIGQMFDRASADGKFFGNLSWTWDVTLATGTVILVGDFFANLIPYTASQDVVQRYLTTKDQKQAARAILTNAALTVPFSLLFFGMGTALYVFYKSFPQRLDPQISTDQIFPLFMVRELPAGVAGLVVAGIFAAAQPTSNLNSMATAFVTDFYKRVRADASDETVLRLAQRLTVLFGVMGTGVALLIAMIRLESIWDLFLQLIGLTGGALAGLFALGIFTRRAHGVGALVGACVSVAALYCAQRYTKINFFLYGAIGILVCFVVGYAASLILPGERKLLDGLTIFTRRLGAGGPRTAAVSLGGVPAVNHQVRAGDVA